MKREGFVVYQIDSGLWSAVYTSDVITVHMFGRTVEEAIGIAKVALKHKRDELRREREEMRRSDAEWIARQEAKQREKERRESVRKEISDDLRFLVLKRDGYRCRICGHGADDGVKLHVDHIVAVANGGTSDRENLQTLCASCNIGKRARPMFDE